MRVALPADDSLRVLVSRWENGRATPDVAHQALLQAAYGLPASALGFDSENSSDAASTAISIAAPKSMSRLTPVLHRYLSAQLRLHAQADNLMGPSLLLSTVQTQAADLNRLLRDEQHKAPRETYVLAAQFNEFTGWLLQDLGKFDLALSFTNMAVDLAQLGNDPAVEAYCLMRKSATLVASGEHSTALHVAQASTKLAHRAAPDLLAVCLRQEAIAAAHSIKKTVSERAIDSALQAAEEQHPSILDPYCTAAYVEMEAADSYLTLHDAQRAAESCAHALSQWPGGLIRDRSLCTARLALSLSLCGDIEESCASVIQAVDLIEAAPSARAIATTKQTMGLPRVWLIPDL
jgi:tetratricopeptide (TPR) repeat protein